MKHIRTGFTLIELLVVIALIGILAMIATPAFSDYLDSSRLQFSQQLLETTLGKAFSHARSHPGKVTVSGDIEGEVIIIKTNNSDGSTTTLEQELDGGVKFNETFSIIFKSPYGDIDATHTILPTNNEIRLQGRNYHAITKVYSESGLVETLSPKIEN